ncbi:ArsB/NhaD family transporter [Terrisporobacter sp.]|uniref:SLC13 family permease n=1 Tax=Terrisporobacter sp. TaxID=1965305 RepID=UPI00262666A0|nr:ArsB/NhaD family transporter [Terrisporobacter sp.]
MNTQLISILIFLVVILSIVTEKIDRTVAAISGAVLMILTNVLTLEEGISHIDFNTIGVLIGMMIVVSVVKNSGLFEYIAIFTAKKSKGDPWKVMVSFMVITALLSAFLDNVTTVLLIGPMTIVICQILKINPVPFLITQIIASNVGGTSTLIGDPPNIMIGSSANLSFTDFIVNLGPIVIIILIFVIYCFKFIYKNSLISGCSEDVINKLDEEKAIQDKPLLIKSLIVLFLILLGFIFHSKIQVESSIVALTGACVMLLIGKQDVNEIIDSIEWTTILFFVGLFVVVGGLSQSGVIHNMAMFLIDITNGNMTLTVLLILWISAIVSSFLDNIPFVATLIPLILTMQTQGIDVTPLWWATSLGACLGGNGTLIGASANVVLANIGEKHGYEITFKKYFSVGFPIMILTVILSTVYLLIRF